MVCGGVGGPAPSFALRKKQKGEEVNVFLVRPRDLPEVMNHKLQIVKKASKEEGPQKTTGSTIQTNFRRHVLCVLMKKKTSFWVYPPSLRRRRRKGVGSLTREKQGEEGVAEDRNDTINHYRHLN